MTLKPTHQPVKAYYESLYRFQALDISHEGAVKTAFQHVLEAGCRLAWIKNARTS